MLRHLLFYIAYLIEHITTILIKHLLNYIEEICPRQAIFLKSPRKHVEIPLFSSPTQLKILKTVVKPLTLPV